MSDGAGSILERGVAESFHLKMENGVFLAVTRATPPEGRGIVLSDGELRKEFIQGILKSLIERFGKAGERSGQKLEMKIIGSPRCCEKLGRILKASGYQDVKQVARAGSFELLFYPATCRIMITKPELPPKKKRVLIVDDSSTIRQLLSRLLGEDPELEVVGTAERPSQVESMIQELKPDVITLDIHMPEMDGVELLRKLLPRHPVPAVMISSISKEDGNYVLNALECGAVDYIQKPSFGEIQRIGPMIVEKVKAAATARVRIKGARSLEMGARILSSEAIAGGVPIVMGSSTGGTEALKTVLIRLPERIPPIAIVQHIPPLFSKAFAERMNELCPFEVKEAEEGDEFTVNRVLVAPGGKQMKLERKGLGIFAKLTDDPPVNRHKPSVDYLFDSAEEVLGGDCVGVILTGMGGDGARGLLKLKTAGAQTIAQNEETCVVFGMPREAIRMNAASHVVALNEIASKMAELVVRGKRKATA